MITLRTARNLLALGLLGRNRGPHITRYYMYRHLLQFRLHPRREARVLSISHSYVLCKIMGLDAAQITEANYPEFNMLSLPFIDGTFDYIVSDQVLEHVEGNPQTAIDETMRVLKTGGLAIHTTCFINPIHGKTGDYWRFTPDALRLLCRNASEIIEVGSWGNPYVWLVVKFGLRFSGVPELRWHPLNKVAVHNDKRWPVVTWIIAKK